MSDSSALPACGFHYGVPFDVYRSWPAANISTLKGMKKTPLHCKWAMVNPRHSDEMDVGSALHISILEPARFDKEFYIAPEYDGRTKEGKEIAVACQEIAAGRTIIRKKAGDGVDADDVAGMAQGVRRFRAASRILDLPGQCEVSALWKDPVTGILCKARFDKLISKSPIILEIKTCRDASAWHFGKQVAETGYAAQAAYYRWAHKEITGQNAHHVFLAIENKGPWAAALYTLSDATLQSGTLQFRDWLDGYAECLKTGNWPGYPDKVQELAAPEWFNRQDFND